MKFQRFGLTRGTLEINRIEKVYSTEIPMLLEIHATFATNDFIGTIESPVIALYVERILLRLLDYEKKQIYR